MSQVQDCVDVIHQHTKGFKPQIGIILGSGLGQFCDNMKTESSLDFKDLPGFPLAGVGGHAGKLLFGEIKDFTGIDSPYEVPTKSDLVIDTEKLNIEDSVEELFTYVINKMPIQ